MNILKMETSEVESAEKEASEVLHTLLSVERIEKSSQNNSVQQLVVVQGDDGKVQWHSPMQEPIYATFEQANYDQSNETVVWEGTIALDIESINNQNQVLVDDGTIVESEPNNDTDVPAEPKVVKKPVRKKYKKVFSLDERTIELENNVQDVRARFQLGCECNDDSCFRGLNPETVYRHRLNIAELTKEEHDMYLMGVTMACMSDPGVTVKRKERRRLRAHYVYQGRRVCLSAFLYLENCTLYQLKRIRKHIMTHGVTPRVHGNHGKKPHNVFSLDIYRRATNFLKSYIEHYTTSSGNLKSPVVLPSDISRKTIHNAYEIYIKAVAPQGEKVMGYSTFRHFMKEQFPHVRFCKSEPGAGSNNNHSNNGTLKHSSFFSRATKSEQDSIPIGNSNITQVATIPLLLPDSSAQEPVSTPTFIVAPVQQIVQQDYSSFQPHTITVAPISNTFAFTTI